MSAAAPAMLCAALGLALSFAPRGAVRLSLLLLTVCSVAASFLPGDWLKGAAPLGCWISVGLTAATVQLPRQAVRRTAPVLAANAGFWTGALVAATGARLQLVEAPPLVLLCLPGAWIVGRGWGVAVKVAASWLIAVAVLAAALPLAPVPAAQADHME